MRAEAGKGSVLLDRSRGVNYPPSFRTLGEAGGIFLRRDCKSSLNLFYVFATAGEFSLEPPLLAELLAFFILEDEDASE